MNRKLRNIWPILLLCTALLGIGGTAGFFLRPVILPVSEIDDHEEAAEDNRDDHEDHDHGPNMVEIVETTLDNMNIQIGKFNRKDYFESIRIPAKIVERVPQGRRHVTAPIGGRIKKVHITQGQAVRPGDRLFDLQVTDDSLSNSQVELLSLIFDIEANRQQLDRLKPLVDQGVVARKRIIDTELEAQKLSKRKTALMQGLGIRGMDDEQIKNLIKDKKLFKEIGVFAPAIESTDSKTANGGAGSFTKVSTTTRADAIDSNYFTVESIAALEGTNLELGDSLCNLTHHGNLLLKGMAYETDVKRIAIANEQGWNFSAHFGEGIGHTVRNDLPLYQIENHVDDESQTYPVYVELENEIVNENEDALGRRFVNWRFKPGQRSHLQVPVEQWKDQWVVPIEAVAYDGPQAFVFQKVNHTHESPEGTVHEFAKTSVKVLHKDRKHVVLEKSQLLKKYEDYALDQAYQLNLVLKAAASGGGGHAHHGHAH